MRVQEELQYHMKTDYISVCMLHICTVIHMYLITSGHIILIVHACLCVTYQEKKLVFANAISVILT